MRFIYNEFYFVTDNLSNRKTFIEIANKHHLATICHAYFANDIFFHIYKSEPRTIQTSQRWKKKNQIISMRFIDLV